MHDTVDLLEAIGRNPNLRHASPEELAKALEAAGASEGLLELVATGDSAALAKELGLVQMHVEHHSQTGGHEGEHDHDHDHHHHPDDDKEKKDKDGKNPDESNKDTSSP